MDAASVIGEASQLQQVMSAQAQATATVNGVDRQIPEVVIDNRENPGDVILGTAGRMAGTTTANEASTSYGAVEAAVMDQPMTSTARPPREGPESLLGQGEQQPLLTTPGVDGTLRGGMSAVRGDATTSQMGFVTPRSTTQAPVMQNNWLAGLEVPRWVSRLGSYLSVNHGDLLPSPLATASLSSPTPPGGPTFVLRSPSRVARTTQVATPPSSDVSAGAIQAEVQRQLGGILARLQMAEGQNEELRRELDAERDRLRELQARQTAERQPASRLLGTSNDDDRGRLPGRVGESAGGVGELREPQGVWNPAPLPVRDPVTRPLLPTELWGSNGPSGDPTYWTRIGCRATWTTSRTSERAPIRSSTTSDTTSFPA